MYQSTPLDQFLFQEKESPDDIYLKQPINGEWVTWTWAQAADESRRIAAMLLSNGLKANDHIAILSKNCAHWVMADLAIMMIGAVSIPIYPTLSSSSIQPILEHSETKAIFIGKLDNYKEQQNGIPSSIKRFGTKTYDTSTGNDWEDMIAKHNPITDVYKWKPEELFTIIYTSGTTGKPKGVMHSAGTIGIVLKTVVSELKLNKGIRLFSYLPLSHIAERLAIEMNSFYSKGTISFSESLELFAKNLADTQPDVFFAVPRIWAKFQEGILKKMPDKKLNTLLKIPIINSLIRNGIKKKLGLSRATHILSAAAPISADLQRWFDKIGINILQVYGMSEDCVYAHFNKIGENRFGTVGKPLPGLLVKFSAEGEICVKSPGNFSGYFKEPELTAEVFDEEGYFKTGDKGQYDKDGYLTITGRVKDQFKTDKGKYISPAPIELKLMENKDIEQICVVGMGIPMPIALITLSQFGKAKTKEEIISSLSETLKQVNPGLEAYERVTRIIILKEDWTIENGLLTPTLKVKRNEVEKGKLPFYPDWYKVKDIVQWE